MILITGPEFGGAIGVMFTLANSIAVAVYLIGFCDSLLDMLEQYLTGYNGIVAIPSERVNDVRLIGSISLVLILGLAIVGMDWVTRVQIGLLFLLLCSQVDFIIGSFLPTNDEEEAKGFVGYNYTVLQENLWSRLWRDGSLIPCAGRWNRAHLRLRLNLCSIFIFFHCE